MFDETVFTRMITDHRKGPTSYHRVAERRQGTLQAGKFWGNANSGLATSAWLGKVQQGNDPAGRKAAQAIKDTTIYTIPAAEAQEFRRKARLVERERRASRGPDRP